MTKKHGIENYDHLEKLRDEVFKKLGGAPGDFPTGFSGIGIGISSRSEDDAIGVKVLCATKDASKRFQKLAGDTIEGVPIYYEVVGRIRPLSD